MRRTHPQQPQDPQPQSQTQPQGSLHHPHRRRRVLLPGRVTIPVEHLDRYHPIPHGTTAHNKSVNRRNQIENLNGILRDKGGLADRWCHALGDAARLVGSVMMSVAYLLRETKQAWLNNNGNADHSPEASDSNDEADGGADDEPAPRSEGHNSADRSRDGPE